MNISVLVVQGPEAESEPAVDSLVQQLEDGSLQTAKAALQQLLERLFQAPEDMQEFLECGGLRTLGKLFTQLTDSLLTDSQDHQHAALAVQVCHQFGANYENRVFAQ